MNLWAKRIGQLALIAVALFFFSCEDEATKLGYPNPNKKFKVSFIEIPLETSVLLRDSLRTSNFFSYGEVNRLLVGSYQDDVFGNISAEAYSQIFTVTQLKLPAAAVYDSIVLQLRFDLYNQGSAALSPQTYSVYELNSDLKFDSLRYYFNRTNAVKGQFLGSKTYTVNQGIFNEFAKTPGTGDTILLRIKLDQNFGQRIFNTATTYRDAKTAADSAYVRYSEFIKLFKGLAIKAESSDKIVGFNPTAAETQLFMHYHEAGTQNDSLVMALGLGASVAYNKITADRGATELAPLNKYYDPTLITSDKRYIQSGTGVITKIDFSNFFSFADTVDNILINSAELVIEDVEQSSFAPPAALSLRVLMDSNRPKIVKTGLDSTGTLLTYNGFLLPDVAVAGPTGGGNAAIVDSDFALYAAGDLSPLIVYNSTKKSYSGVLSLLLQQLALKNETKPLFRNYALYPASQAATVRAAQSSNKSVNRTVFPKDKVKLRIRYTKPTGIN